MSGTGVTIISRQVIRVEPISTYLERWKAPTSAVVRHGDAVYARYFPAPAPARISVAVPDWPGNFDIEIDCIAAVR